jgi:hypothetical protein
MNGEMFQGEDFWLYDARDNNCQIFVMSLLKGNKLGDQQLYEYVLQDAKELLGDRLKKISRALTDVAGISDIILHGHSLLF